MKKVWIYADIIDAGLELITIGKQLADQLGGTLTAILAGDEKTAQDFINCGADEVLLLPELEPTQPIQDYVPVIVEAAQTTPPEIFLISASLTGKEMAARIAAQLNTGLCSDCQNLVLDEQGLLHMDRLVYGGAWIQTLKCLSKPQMATIPLHRYEKASSETTRQGKITRLENAKPSGIKIVEKRKRDQSQVNIKDARVIVCAGRGLENEKDLDMIRELAKLLKGEVACTRPLSEEKHWLPDETCIGLSAQEVKPDIYIGIGISGQIQHMVGVRDAGIICAINSDEKAPIFQAADFGIQGDLYKVVPMLIEELKR